jgi:hypothetical protein
MNESNFSGNRNAVVVNVEGTHEYPYQNFRTGYVLFSDIVESGFDAPLDIDHALLRLHPAYIYHRAVSRAEYAGSFRRNDSLRIAKKPDMTPKQIKGGAKNDKGE